MEINSERVGSNRTELRGLAATGLNYAGWQQQD